MDVESTLKKWRKRFQFDRRWLQYKDVEEVVRKAWNKQCNGSKLFKDKNKIKYCKMDLLNWNRNLNGNIGKLIKNIKKELLNVKNSNMHGKAIKIVGLKKRLADT